MNETTFSWIMISFRETFDEFLRYAMNRSQCDRFVKKHFRHNADVEKDYIFQRDIDALNDQLHRDQIEFEWINDWFDLTEPGADKSRVIIFIYHPHFSASSSSLYNPRSSLSAHFACRCWMTKKKFHLYEKFQKVRPDLSENIDLRTCMKVTDPLDWDWSRLRAPTFVHVLRSLRVCPPDCSLWGGEGSFLTPPPPPQNHPLFLRSNFLKFPIQMEFFFRHSTSACEMGTQRWWWGGLFCGVMMDLVIFHPAPPLK